MTKIDKPNSFRNGPDERGHFGIFGGRFVAETLMPLVLSLEQAYEAAKARIWADLGPGHGGGPVRHGALQAAGPRGRLCQRADTGLHSGVSKRGRCRC